MQRQIGLVAPLPPQVGGVASFAGWLLEHEEELGCRYVTFDLRRPAGAEVGGRWRIDAAARQVGLLAAFARWLPRAPRVVHYCVSLTASGLPRDTLFLSLLRAAGRRPIAHVHGPSLDPAHATAKRTLLDAVARLSAARVTVIPLEGWAFVPNPLRFTPAAHANGRPTARLRVLSVGGAGPLKGSDVLVEALARARREGADLELRIVGGEVRRNDEASLRAHARAAGVEDVVTLTGALPPAAVEQEYSAADIFCLPSPREGLPMSLLEAMACEVPAVATPVGAIPRFVDDTRTGLLVSVGDVAALSDALGRLAGDGELRQRLGQAGAALVRRECDPAAVAARWRALYAEVAR